MFLVISRSSHSHMFFEIGVLKIFSIFIGKHLCRSLIKLLGFRPATYLKRASPIQVFSCEYYKNRTEHLWWLLLYLVLWLLLRILVNIIYSKNLALTCLKSTVKTPEHVWICSNLTIKTPRWSQWRHSGIFTINFEQGNAI